MQQQQQQQSMSMSMGMGMGMIVRVRMRTACRMHSIARNAAWHGSRAQWEGHMGWQDKNTRGERGMHIHKHTQMHAQNKTPAQRT